MRPDKIPALLLSRLRRFTQREPLPIYLAIEDQQLVPVTSQAKLTGRIPPGSGVSLVLRKQGHIEESDLKLRLRGRIGGCDAPVWADGSGGAPQFGLQLHRATNVLHAPSLGAIVMRNGAVLKTSVGEALYLTPDLSGLPNVVKQEGGLELILPRRIPRLRAATVFMGWGGIHNYGHFLLDCAPAICAAEGEGLAESHRLVSPPLSNWQRTLLRLLGGASVSKILEIQTPWIEIDDVVFASTMDHFLHAPGAPLDAVRDRILRNAGPSISPGPDRIYLSRRRDQKRPLLNELALEAALLERGFEIVHAADIAVEEQIKRFRDARVIVGPTGAAFANCLFCAADTKIFELQPTNYTGIWVRGLCHYLNLDWHAYFTPSPVNDIEIGELPLGAMFSWRLDLKAFLNFLDERL